MRRTPGWGIPAPDADATRTGPAPPAERAAWALALTATLTLSAAACGGDDDPGPTADDTTTTTAKTTTTKPSPRPSPEKLPDGHFIDLHLPDDLTAEEKEVAEAYRDALRRSPGRCEPAHECDATPTRLRRQRSATHRRRLRRLSKPDSAASRPDEQMSP